MLRRAALLVVAISFAASAGAQSPPTPPAGQAVDPADTSRPRVVPGFDPAAMDRSAKPCDDFYQFACGGWLAGNPVPADRGRYGRFDELQERNQATLRDILEKAASAMRAGSESRPAALGASRPSGASPPDPQGFAAAPDSIDQKIGDYYAACMDEAAIEKKGVAALKPQLDAIAAIDSRAALAPALARLHTDGVSALFQFGSQPDYKQASVNIAAVDQGGLGLPDRDYYVKDESRFAGVRAKYPGHVQRMFELLGATPEAAAGDAKTVLEIETALARASLERVKRRDPANRYHKMSRAELGALAPGFDWAAYFTAAGAPAFADLNVGWPEFFKAVGELVASRSLDDWKTYLRWHAARKAAPLLPVAFVNENFAFYGTTLTGAKELRPRWKRCVELADSHLGEALGQRYVEATFGAEGKQRMSVMVAALEKALEKDIRELPWMTEATKKRALDKLEHVANKIGYPERWRDYSAVRIDRGDAVGNASRAEAFEEARDRAKIGTPVDPAEWRMTPPTVNAYYSPLENNINFPAGILQPPFFDRAMDDAVNFGGIGAVIGHELTHGFDDQGRKFDARGNMTDWWTEGDAREFEKRASCVADQYSDYVAVGDVKLDGRLTLGENTADNGGLRVAYMALQEMSAMRSAPPEASAMRSASESRRAAQPDLRDGFTPEQRLFLAWGQIWCQNATEETLRLRAQTDPHSPGRYRVIGVVSNMPEFQKAFGCPAGSKMVREPACRVW